MQPDFWHQRWRTREIGFHRSQVHPFLERWWPMLPVETAARVYVPLCGKSFDMAWLAQRGHAVVGTELSPIAIGEFFQSQGLKSRAGSTGRYVRHEAGPYAILEGDALSITAAELGPIGAVYDRAALVALPPAMRARYAATLAELTPAGAPVLLVAFEYPQGLKEGPPFAVLGEEIRGLFGAAFMISELERVDLIDESPKFVEAGIRALHEVAYRLERKP